MDPNNSHFDPNNFAPLRLGLLGLSPSSQSLVDAAHRSGRVEIVAVAVRDRARLAEWSADGAHAEVTVYNSYNDLLRDGNIDAVYVGLPTRQHVPWCCAAAKMHKHVLVEPPLASELADALAMREACAAEDVVLMDASMFAHHQRTREMFEEVLCRRDFGEVRRVNAAYSFSATADFIRGSDDARAAEDDPLGCLGDLGWYCARAGLLAFGPDAVPRSCQAHLSEANSAGVPMDCTGVCYFDDDHKKVLHFHASFLHPLRQWLEVVGDHKVLTCDDFVIPRFPKECFYSVESFPGVVSPLIDLETCVVSAKNATRVTGAKPQRVAMLEAFADLCLYQFPQRALVRKREADAAVHAQALCSGLVESCRQDGALLSCAIDPNDLAAAQADAAHGGADAKKRKRDDDA